MAIAVNQRNSAMEILRIISMFLIIVSHYFTHGTTLVPGESLNGTLSSLISFGNIGTAVFILLSGYFLINSRFTFKKIFTLVSQVVFYSVVIYSLCCVFQIQSFSFSGAIKALLPTTFSLYWFFTTYVVLYALSPFINKLLNNISRSAHLKLIITTLFFWSVLPTISTKSLAGNDLSLLIALYIIGAYLKKYPNKLITHKKIDILIIAISIFIVSSFALCIICFVPSLSKNAAFLHSRFSIFIILIAVALISVFSKIKPFYSKLINTVAGATFGIYLIHDNKFFREFMWQNIFKTAEYQSSNYMIIHLIGCSITIFAVCFIVEFIRKQTIEKGLLLLYDKIYDKLNPKISVISEKIFKQ